MADIKIKEKKKGTVKTLNKAIVNTEKVKDKSIQMKNKVSEAYKETNENGTNYAINRISRQTKRTPDDIRRLNRIGKRNFKKTVENTQKTVDRIRKIKSRNKTRKSIKQVRKTAKATKKTVKTADRTIKTTKKAAKTTAKATFKKTVENTQKTVDRIRKIKSRNKTRKSIKQVRKTAKATKKTVKTADRTIKTTKKAAKTTAKATKKTVQATKAAVKATIKTIKVVIKITITAIKTIIAALKSLIALIIAGGWISVIIIVVVCLVALIAHSIFGIFLSSQDMGSKITINGEQQVVTMDRVISNLNTEFINKMTQIQKDNKHDEYDINSKRAEWRDILAVYTVKISNGKNDAEVMTLDNNKISILKEIFWEMNEITSSTEEATDKDNKKKIVLHINVNGKDALEMAQKYNFSIEQNKQLAELLDKQYASLWSSVIYGSSVGNTDIVEVAKKQIGNIGGQPFWSWYGYNSRVEWCACFVSWCANECGYIEAGIIPKFASCESEGVAWFKTCGLWQEKGYTPKSGDIIFFDWADSNDGLADHVGIVSRVENGIIYTVEGNTRGDVCKENKYSIDSSVIRGFGTPAYK